MPSSKTADWNIEGHMTRATIVKIAVHRCRRCEPTGDGGWGTQWQLNLNAGFAIPLRRQLTLGLTCKVGRFAYCDFSPQTTVLLHTGWTLTRAPTGIRLRTMYSRFRHRHIWSLKTAVSKPMEARNVENLFLRYKQSRLPNHDVGFWDAGHRSCGVY